MVPAKRPARPRPGATASGWTTPDVSPVMLKRRQPPPPPADDLGPPIKGRYQLLSKVGNGGYGEVYRARDNHTGETVAVKCLYVKDDEEEEMMQPSGLKVDADLKLEADLDVEVSALEACRGLPHIVQVLDHGCWRHRPDGNITASDGVAFIVMEYVGSSLQNVISRRGLSTKQRRYCEDDVRMLMRQLLSGVKGMHDVGLMHRDLKMDNVLVDCHGVLKICDLGFARRTKLEDGDGDEAGPPFTIPVAAKLYRAPEVYAGSTAYNELIDTWALGCIMAELLTDQPLFRGYSGSSDSDRIKKVLDILGTEDIEGWSCYDEIKDLTTDCRRESRLRDLFPLPGQGLATAGGGIGRPELSQAGFEVLSGLLACNPEKRMTAAGALQHHWFST